jgi:hypothetical protein
MKLALPIALILINATLLAQLQDDFADGDFTNNPTWGGETTNFTIDANRLRLNAPAVDAIAYLSAASEAIHNATWEFYVEMGFATSGTSLTRVYLVSDQANLKQPLNGYFVMIGNTADEVSLYKQTGTTLTKIIDGVDARVSGSPVRVTVRVTRDGTGTWALFADVNNTGTFIQEASSVVDVTHSASAYMGVYCQYIASRSTLFWFDDFMVTGSPAPDVTPPTITAVTLLSPDKLRVDFSEVINPTSGSYSIALGPNNTLQPGVEPVFGNTSIDLGIGPDILTNGLTYTLEVSDVLDVSGNTMASTNQSFLYFFPTPVLYKDVIVSEFMADPTPPVGLPEAEFIELFNRSVNPVQLLNWTVTDGSTTATLPNYILLPNQFIVLSTTSAAASFQNALGVSGFPSLNNSGDAIIIKNDLSETIDSIRYSITWYHNQEKQDGGWSLEIVDPENLCEEEGNWTASENATGGTPGAINSVNASNPDVTPPVVESAVIEAANQIRIAFNEKLDGRVITALLIPSITIQSITFANNLRELIIVTDQALTPSTSYTLALENVYDCSGNALLAAPVQVILPEVALPGDVLLNEVLFNPKSGGVDFVEVVNTTDKYISLKKWSLANVENEIVLNNKFFDGALIIAPKAFMVFTSNIDIVKAHYPRTIESNCIVADLPALNDDEGSIALVDSLNQTIDFFLYADDFHSIFLKDKEGVSLERVSLTATTNVADNWRSASQQENFATPGYKNSASLDGQFPTDGDVLVDPEIFSPQQPPTSFTTIQYKFNQSGKVANASILDHQGRLIKTLANNEVLGTDGFFRWDGDRDDGGQARAGYYIAWLEVFDQTGNVQTYRKRVVVSGR